jgi:hypothetical protein
MLSVQPFQMSVLRLLGSELWDLFQSFEGSSGGA